jgi:alpha-tubulin suppressor-like RCC1 family protein
MTVRQTGKWIFTMLCGIIMLLALIRSAPAGVSQPKISGGLNHTISLKPDGTAWAWGQNNFGQLGNGTNTNSNTPVQVWGLTGVIAIAAGAHHSLAVESDGTVRAWGMNNFGQLGDGTYVSNNIPVQVSGLTNIASISAGLLHSVALKPDGTVWTWGGNEYGQLGDGTYTRGENTPVRVSGLTGVIDIDAWGWHNLAVKSDGTVWAWGRNIAGQLGDGTYTRSKNIPVQVNGLTGVIAIAAGGGHSLAVKSDGTVWAWGLNNFGQLGDGTNIRRKNIPVQVNGLTGVIDTAAGGLHSLAVKSDGTVWAWGRNNLGQLGDETNTSRNTPVQVSGFSNGTTDIAIAAGSEHSLALKSDGTFWAWGGNVVGQLGNGTNIDSNIPVQVSGLTNVISIAAGETHSLALKSDGTVWAWGANWYGQLGDGTNTDRWTPVQAIGFLNGDNDWSEF